jgi:WD40 repeat protein
LHLLEGHQGNISSAAFEPSGPLLLTTSEDKRARVWNSKTGKIQAVLPHSAPVRRAEFSPSGKLIISLTDTGKLYVWTTGSGWKLEQTIEAGGADNGLDFALSPDERWLVTWSWKSGDISVWDVAAGKQITKITAHAAGISNVAFSHDSRSFVSGSFDGTAQVYSCRMCRSVEELSREAKERGLREWADGERSANIGDTSVRVLK